MSIAPAPQNGGFRIGTSQDALTQTVYTTDLLSGASGSFSATVSGLASSTKYYYQAFMTVYGSSGYTEIVSTVSSFTTSAPAASGNGYLGCYEIPAIPNRNGQGTKGTNSERDDNWFRYYTSNAQQQVATHTFTHPSTSKQTRTYTVLYDGDKYAPLWTAHAMHSTGWPDKNVGRNEAWGNDPAIGLIQQSGVDAGSYSKGHMVASNYRQSTVKENKQTFYYTNQAPQWQTQFNDGIWNQLENAVVAHVPSGSDTLYVVTGVLYEGNVSTSTCGNLTVPIPSHFYKCLMLCSFNGSGEMTAASGCAYLFTNKAHANETYSGGLTTIDAVEQRAGFDFFANVPVSLQTTAETQSAGLW